MGFLKNLFGKQEKGPPYQGLVTDMHSHLIPGIDDGAKDMEDSLNLIRSVIEMGFTRIITTPHIMSDAFRNTPETILGGLEKLKVAMEQEGLDIPIEAAAEYYLDEFFLEMLENQELLTFGGDKKYLLFETSYISRPLSLKESIFRMKSRGYTPILAHPERYQYFWEIEDMKPIAELKERGALMQINLTSFAGTRGKRASRIAREMAREGLVDFVGTDLHRTAQLPALNKAFELSKELRQLVETGKLLNASL